MKKDDINKAVKDELAGYVDRIVKFQQGVCWIGNERMENGELAAIAQECKMLKELRIWKIFQEKIRFNAVENMMLANDLETMQDAKRIIKVLNDFLILT